MKPTPTSSKDFFDRAAKIDVDNIKTSLDQLHRTSSKLFWLGPHQLPANGMLFIGDMQKMAGSFSLFQIDQELIQHDFANGIGCSQPSGDHSHRPIAVSRKRSLNDRESNIHVANF